MFGIFLVFVLLYFEQLRQVELLFASISFTKSKYFYCYVAIFVNLLEIYYKIAVTPPDFATTPFTFTTPFSTTGEGTFGKSFLISNNQKSNLHHTCRITCNEWRGPSTQLSAWATQLRKNVATVASRLRHCADLTGPGIELLISRIYRGRFSTELKL